MKIEDIRLDRNYSRMSGVGDVTELAESMQAQGLLSPVLVSSDGYLVYGFRRLAAAKLLGWEEIPATQSDKPAVELKFANLIENLHRENPCLWDEIQGIREIFGEDATPAQVSNALKMSRKWAKPRVLIWKLPDSFIQKVRYGQATVSDINRELAKLEGKTQTPAGVLKSMPSHEDVKAMVSWLYSNNRRREAQALSYACGIITEVQLKQGHV